MDHEDRARRHAESAEAHIADDDAAAHASLAACYATLETNELLRRLLAERSTAPPRRTPPIPQEPRPDRPDPLIPPVPPRPGLAPDITA